MAQLKDSLITGDLRVTGTIYGDVPLADLTDADDLKAIEALTGTSGTLTKTAANTWALSSGVTPASHTHGNLSNDGKITATAQIANGDKLVIVDTDSTAGNKIVGTTITFDGTTTNKALTPKGTWESFTSYTHPAYDEATAAAIKVGRDATGHVVIGDALTKSDVGLSNVTNDAQVKKAGDTMTGALTLSGAPTADLHAATKKYVDDSFAVNDAMIFKGTLGTGGTITSLPASHNRGWTYKIITAGTYAEKVCEVGDLIICTTDSTTANNDHWVVVQSNLDGAVIGPASATDNAIVRFDGTTGKLIQNNSGVTIDDNGKLTTAKAINALITGSGTAASDKGEGVSPRYFPAKWTFNTGSNAANGDIYTIKIPCAGHSYGVYMSVNNGSNYYPVVHQNSNRITTHYPNGYIIAVIFDSGGQAGSMTPLAGADSANGSTITGGVFRVINYYDSGNTNTLLRTYSSSTNINVPLIGSSSANSTTAAWSTYTGTYKDWYGVIPNDDAKRAKINLSTGAVTMPGGVTVGSDSTAYNTKGVVFPGGSRIGENSSAALGIYSGGNVYLRPNAATSSGSDGVEISTSGLYPSNNNSENLGATDHLWANVYATTFNGALSGNASSASTVTTTEDTTNALYPIGVTSGATTTLKRDTSITMQGGVITAGRGIFTNTTDAAGTANNGPALVVGGAATSTHLELDANEIMAKTNGTSVAALYINNDGGLVTIGSGGLATTATTDATSSTAASMKTAGGLAVAKKIWAGSGLGASTNTNNSSQLIISSSDTGDGGNVALELWRGTKASWQISNEGGELHFRSNWTGSKQTTYSLNALKIDHTTGRVALLKGQALNQLLTGSGTAATTSGSNYVPAKWTFNTGANAINGDIFTIKIPVVGHDYGTYMSVNNGTNYYPVVTNSTNRVTGHFQANDYLTVIFESGGSAASMFPLAGGTSRSTVTGGVFKVLNYYDSGNSGLYQNYSPKAYKVGATAISQYDLVAEDNGGLLVPAHSVAHRVGSPIYISDRALGANATGSWANLYNRHYNYTMKKGGTAITTTTYNPVYLKGTIANGIFTPDTTTPFITTKAGCNVAGAYYMYIGDAVNGSGNLSFNDSHPYYYYDGTNLLLYSETVGPLSFASGNTITGNGSTTAFTVTHAFDTKDVLVQVYAISTGETVECDVVRATNSTVTVTFATAPANGTTYRVLIMSTSIANVIDVNNTSY